jgi:very-short-patch-repair endonuclease
MAFQKGYTPWNMGKSSGMKGKTHTKETKDKISSKLKGRNVWNKGTKGLMKATKGCFKKGHKSLLKGTHITTNTGRTHFKKGHIPQKPFIKGSTPWNKGTKGLFSVEAIYKIKMARANQVLPLKDTKPERIMQVFLKNNNIEFVTHHYINNIKHSYQCDIFIPSKNLIIECDGDYWHGNPIKFPNPNKWQLEQIEKDKIRTQELQEAGYKVIRLWENEILANKDIYSLDYKKLAEVST